MTLETAVTQFICENVEFLKGLTPPSVHAWKLPHSDGKSTHYGTAPDWARVLVQMRVADAFAGFKARLLQFGEVTAFLDAAKDAGLFLAQIDAIPEFLLRAYLEDAESLEFDAERAGMIASNFADAARRQVRADVRMAPLEGFRTNEAQIECFDGWVIRPIDPTTYTRLFTPNINVAMADQFRIWPFVVEKVEEARFADGPRTYYSYDPAIDQIVQALRLLGPERISAGRMLMRTARPGAIGMHGMQGWPGVPKVAPFDTAYELHAADVPVFQTILSRVAKDDFTRATSIAIGRVTSAGNRLSLEDAFIDYVVALEALFGDRADGLPGGITYKIALRAAMFTESDEGARKAVLQGLKRALNLRGKLVHGAASMAPGDADQKATLDFVAATVRKALRIILVELPSPQIFKEGYVDDLILSGARVGE